MKFSYNSWNFNSEFFQFLRQKILRKYLENFWKVHYRKMLGKSWSNFVKNVIKVSLILRNFVFWYWLKIWENGLKSEKN